MSWNLKDTIFSYFGTYATVKDINKDANGKGTLERYNEAAAQEYDEEILPLKINLIDNNLVPLTALEKYIPYLEQRLGITLFMGSSFETRRRVIQYFQRWVSMKGTVTLLKLLLSMLGFTVNIIEDFTEYTFDSPVTFDDEKRRFDMSCRTCGEYCVELTGSLVLNPEIVRAIFSVIYWNEPIHAHLEKVTYNGDLIEQFPQGFSMDFDGFNEYISVPVNAAYDIQFNNALTISFWVKLAMQDAGMVISKYEGAPTARGYFVRIENGKVRFDIQNSGGMNGLSGFSTTILNTGIWYHIMVSKQTTTDISGMSMWINGSPETIVTNFNNLNATTITTQDLEIGTNTDTGIYFMGQLHKLKMWNIALITDVDAVNDRDNIPVATNNLILVNNMGESSTWDGVDHHFPDPSGTVTETVSVLMEEDDKKEDIPT